MTTEHDILGPRYVFEIHDGDEERVWLQLYAGEWEIRSEHMGEDCLWHEHPPEGYPRNVTNVGRALEISSAEDVVRAHLDWAARLGGAKGGGMRRSLRVHLAKRGLRVVEA